MKKTILAISILSIFLTGCSGSIPTREDMEKTFQKTQERLNFEKHKGEMAQVEVIPFIKDLSDKQGRRFYKAIFVNNTGVSSFGYELGGSPTRKGARKMFDFDVDAVDFSIMPNKYKIYYKYDDLQDFVKTNHPDVSDKEFDEYMIEALRANVVNYLKNMYNENTGKLETPISDKYDYSMNFFNQIFALSIYEKAVAFEDQQEKWVKYQVYKKAHPFEGSGYIVPQKPDGYVNQTLSNNIYIITYQAVGALKGDAAMNNKPFVMTKQTTNDVLATKNMLGKDDYYKKLLDPKYIQQQIDLIK
jgi:hypothetical protein